MAQLKLHLLGRPEIWLDSTPLTRLNNKAKALVYYVATTRQAASRELLAGLLWSDFTEKRARGNLRVELGKLRPLLGSHLHIQRQSVAFAFASDHQVDLKRFEELLNQPSPTAAQIEEAAALYKGDFLADFSLKGAPLFEEWQLVQQARLRQTILGALLRLSAGYGQEKRYEEAITAARRQVEIEPWSEVGHQALMRWFALSGQKLSALAQYDQCREILWTELAEEPGDETETIYNEILTGQLTADADATTMQIAVPQTASAPFQPLPPSHTFVGRKPEINQFRTVLDQGTGPHLVALVGMGGIGKTSIANQISHALRGSFVDGVLWANVETTEPLDILHSWGQAYGFDFGSISDLSNRSAAVRDMLTEKKVLVVLDNVVELSSVRPLLPNGKQCVVLLTTRDLDVATALNADVIRVDELSLASGRQLFTNILGAARVSAEVDAVDEICHRLQFHPLALEITAMRLKSRQRRTLRAMSHRLQTVEQRIGLELKDRVVRASFEVSWDALDEALKDVFARLSVFGTRSFTLDAVAYVIDKGEYETEDHLFLLSALSLIREVEETRFELHSLLADFAREKIGAKKEMSLGRMSHYYLQFAENNQEKTDQLAPEWSNLLFGMQVAYETKMWGWVVNYARALLAPWFRHIRNADIRLAMGWSVEAAQALGDQDAIPFFKMKSGQAAIEQASYDEAKASLIDSLNLYQTLENKQRIAEIKFNLARIAYEEDQQEYAFRLLDESLQISKQLKDSVGIARALFRQAFVLDLDEAELPRAKKLVTEACELLAHHEDWFWYGCSIRLLAEIAIRENDLTRAEALCHEAQKISLKIDDKSELESTYFVFARLYQFQGKLNLADDYLQRSIDLCRYSGNLRGEVVSVHERGKMWLRGEAPVRALPHFEECLRLSQTLDNPLRTLYAYIRIGDCQHLLGQRAMAKQSWLSARNLVATYDGGKQTSIVEAVDERLRKV